MRTIFEHFMQQPAEIALVHFIDGDQSLGCPCGRYPTNMN